MLDTNGAIRVERDQLMIEDIAAQDLAKEFGTPIFVISENQLRQNARRIKKAFQDQWPEGQVDVYPAFKAAPYIAIRRILSEEGYGCDTFGPSELEGALRGETNPQKLSVNGSLKSREVIARGIEVGARIVIDALREVSLCVEEARRLGKAARVMLRLKPDLSKLDITSDFAPLPVGELTQRIRYGLPYEEAVAAAKIIAAHNETRLIGFHCHIGRQSTDLKLWAGLVEHMVDMSVDVCTEAGLTGYRPDHLDFGGGFAPPRDFDTDGPRSGMKAPAIESYAQAMMSALRSTLDRHQLSKEGLTVEIEPGRSLHADTGLHLTEVANIKSSKRFGHQVWAELDTSEVFLGTFAMDPSTRLFQYLIANKANTPATQCIDLVGKSCNGEMILLDADVPDVNAGDIVALMDTGAYIESLSCNFNAMPRPGTVLVNARSASWIRQPETIQQVYARDSVPDWL